MKGIFCASLIYMEVKIAFNSLEKKYFFLESFENHIQLYCTNPGITGTGFFFTGWMSFLPPNHQCQSTEGNTKY